jgi:hypothetical protein
MYSQIPTRTGSDPNAASDINQLQDNFDNSHNSDGTYKNIQFTDTTGTTGLYGSLGELKYENQPLGINGVGFIIGGTVSTGEDKLMIPVPHSFTIKNVIAGVKTAPVTGTLAVDVNYHATNPSSMTTIFTTQANRPQIASGNYSDVSATPDVTAITAGGFLAVSVDSIGSATAGATLGITVVAR